MSLAAESLRQSELSSEKKDCSTAREAAAERLPDYLPARMVNEFVYCPRLFFYEWVEGLFRDSADTIEGRIQHRRVDGGKGEFPAAETAAAAESIHSRSVTLASDACRVIAKIDLIEIGNGTVTPVDYKHGKPQENDDGLALWPADRAQLAVQAIILRDNGYRCEEAVAYYRTTRQRVRLAIDDALLQQTRQIVQQAWETAARGILPAPLEGSAKCNGCSLAPICLPDETNALRGEQQEGEQLTLFEEARPRPVESQVRRLVAARDPLRPVYLDTQGLVVGKSGAVLQVKEKGTLKQEIRVHEICQVNLMGNIQLSTQAVQTLCENQVPVCYFSQGGWFYGITTGMNTKNVFLRKAQFRLAEEDWFSLRLARRLVAGKLRNQRTMLLRNHVEPPAATLAMLKDYAGRAERAQNREELLGIEGIGARLYFSGLGGMLKVQDAEAAMLAFDFQSRNRRPPRDPVNALLSLAYSLLAKDFTVVCYAVGFDPLIGFYHQPRFGRPALALDLMEPFRPLVADSAVIHAINTRMVTPGHFIAAGRSVGLTPEGRKAFYRAYEARMDTMVTHPLFGYRVSYRRLLEIQARLLARLLEGEIGEYPVFVTR